MRPISEEEKQKIWSTIAPLLEKKKVQSSCIYGSRVAGYARQESDYDLIVILSNFLQRIKYYYLRGDVECSVLAVDSRSFEHDCSKSSLGEFVAGRLLNPYEVLSNREFVVNNEVNYKKRVILEGLEIAYSENGSFTEELVFDLAYFLFEKLRRRAAIYPPVVYSYALTYGENLISQNKEAALIGFRKAAKELDAEGYIEFLDREDAVKLKSEKFSSRLGKRLSVGASYTARGIRQYAVHGYAGRVGLNVFGHEVASKLSRSKEHLTLPKFIEYPKRFWSLPQTKLFPETSDWLSDLLQSFGMEKESTNVTNGALGEMYSSAKFFTFNSKERSISFAAKRYNDARGMKWGLLNLWTLKNTNFTVGALERMHREFRAIHDFGNIGIATPQVLAVFLSDRILVTQFIEGTDLSTLQSDYLNDRTNDLEVFAKFGELLSSVHSHGFCMGDSKPSNAIFSNKEGKIYLTDLEQAHRNGNPVWDVAEFVYYSVRFTLKESKIRKLIKSFVNGYKGSGGSREVIRKSASLRYRAPFQTFIAPNVLRSVLQDLRSH